MLNILCWSLGCCVSIKLGNYSLLCPRVLEPVEFIIHLFHTSCSDAWSWFRSPYCAGSREQRWWFRAYCIHSVSYLPLHWSEISLCLLGKPGVFGWMCTIRFFFCATATHPAVYLYEYSLTCCFLQAACQNVCNYGRFKTDVKIKSISIIGGAEGTSPAKMRA